MAAISLEDKVQSVLELLGDIEQCIQSDTSTLSSSDAKNFVDRLRSVADLVDKKCNVDYESSVESDASSPAPSFPPSPQLPQQRSAPASMYKRFDSSPPPNVLDEVAKKRRLEAERMVDQLKKKTTFSCGVGYTGDKQEKDFSDGIKEDIKKHLPALKIQMHLFHYMAWATTERLECAHCRQCPNVYPY